MEPIAPNELRGHLETVVLSVLASGRAHGYEIMQRIDQRGEGALEMKEGSLYPVLYRLEAAGYLASEWEKDDVPRKGPRRRQYWLTKSGTRELDRRRDRWRSFVTILGNLVEGTT